AIDPQRFRDLACRWMKSSRVAGHNKLRSVPWRRLLEGRKEMRAPLEIRYPLVDTENDFIGVAAHPQQSGKLYARRRCDQDLRKIALQHFDQRRDVLRPNLCTDSG